MNEMSMLDKIREVKGSIELFCKMLFYNSICKGWIQLLGRHDNRQLKYKVSLCLIFKNEASFLKEWLDYHLTVGVEHFYLYNNNSDDNYDEVLKPYVDKGLVTFINWPYDHSQFKAYQHCYENYRNETNWISFLDADEFFVPKYANTLEEWLKTLDKYPAIVIHWRMFGTGGQLKHDYSKNVIEQYYTCWDHFYPLGKCFINTRYDIASFDLWHVHHHTYMKYPICGIKLTIPAVNQFGYICPVNINWSGWNNKMSEATIFCNHYYTKAWDIYSAKMKRTDVLFEEAPRKKMAQFFKMENECTVKDYLISRFFVKLKITQGIIKL